MSTNRSTSESTSSIEYINNKLQLSKMCIDSPAEGSPLKRLPYEVIEHLFTFLDKASLENCTLINKRSNEIIESSLELGKKFTLHISIEKARDMRSLANLKRRYTKIKISTLFRKEAKFMEEVLRKVGPRIRSAFIHCYVSSSHSQFLDYFPNIETLYVDGYLNVDEPTPSMLAKLKNLTLTNRENLSLFVNMGNLSQLRVVSNESTFQHLTQILQNQSSLDLLEIKFDSNLQDPKLSLPSEFKVRRLFIESRLEQSRNVMDFMFNFRDCGVEVLSFEGSSGFGDDRDFREILENFSTITALKIGFRNLPECKRFYEAAKINTNLTDLVLYRSDDGRLKNVTGLLGLFEIFPNIQNLTVPYQFLSEQLTDRDLKLLNKKFEQLKSLTTSVDSSRSIFPQMPKLKSWTALYIENLDCMIATFPNLRELSVSKLGGKFDFKLAFKFCPKLETLRLGNAFTLILEHLKIIKEKGKNLKSLSVTKWRGRKSLVQALIDLEITGIEVNVVKNNFLLVEAISQRGVFKLE